MASTIKDIHTDAAGTFESLWTEMGVPSVRQVGNTWVTPTYNHGSFERRLRATPEDLEAKGLEDAHVFRGMARHALAKARAADDKVEQSTLEEMQRHNIIDANVAENSTPLVFDPEILDILKNSAPLAFDRLARQGQDGYQAVFNVIDERQRPIGFVDEAQSTRLQDLARDFNLDREDVPMTIYADTAEIADFSATAASHYMNLEDLAIGPRMSEYALKHEQTVLYGDPGVELPGGSPLSENAFRGLATWFDDAGQSESKSAVDQDFNEDIKAEIRELLQGPYATDPTDLEIWTSWTMYDALENELTPRARHDENANQLNFGDYSLQIGGVPVVPSHNVDEHTYVEEDPDDDFEIPADPAEETVGNEGDVFVVNTNTAVYRELAPLSTFPLAVRGAADEVAMVEYGALIERSKGNFGKYLEGYAV